MKKTLAALFCLAAAAVTFGLVRNAFNKQAPRKQGLRPAPQREPAPAAGPRLKSRKFEI